MHPYYVIMVYLTLEALEIIMIIVAFNFLLELPNAHFFTNIIWPIIGTFSIAKFVTYTIFVNCQVFEWYVLWFFMLFQQNLKLNVLHIQKPRYQKLERKFFRAFKQATYFIVGMYLIYLGVYWYFYFILKNPNSSLSYLQKAMLETRLNLALWCFFGLTTVLITLFVSSVVINLLALMYTS
jgi:hypothetical protein